MEKEITFEDLLKKVKTYIKDEKDLELIKNAYLYAEDAHEGRSRLNGEKYITHPLHVALLAATKLNVDAITIASALLHETVNHAGKSLEEIENLFGSEVAYLVECISKMNRLQLNDSNLSSAENLRKVLVGISSDVRVLYIKLCDRLHNMRTIWALDPASQKEKANETIAVLIPIAHRLGINSIKSELEDLSLKYTKPEIYNEIKEKLESASKDLNEDLESMKQSLCSMLEEQKIHYKIKARVKSVHSIYEKMIHGHKWNEIYDILALRIIVDKVSDCYLALGLIHAKYQALPKRFKDYIAMPKENMYQSLHTSIYGVNGFIYEVQIRTFEMDEIAEKGIASHWSYKEHTKGDTVNPFEQKLELFRNLIEQHEESISSKELQEELNKEVLSKMIYCYTPKGDVVELPSGATPIDFAYRIHSKVGDTMIGVTINDIIAPIESALQDGDIVSIKTSNNGTPKKEWLNIVKTSQAKNKIKSYFSKQDRDFYIKRGQELLEKELRKKKISITEALSTNNIEKVCKDLKLDTLEDIYLSIGSLRFTPIYIIHLIYEDKKEVEDILLERVSNRKPTKVDYKSDIIINGYGDLLVSMANCCKPVKGDDIIGYITKGEGIVIHKRNCSNILGSNRLIEVEWNHSLENEYFTDLEVSTIPGKNYFMDLVSLASLKNVSIEKMNTKEYQDKMVYLLTLKIKNKNDLDGFITSIENQGYCKKVERV